MRFDEWEGFSSGDWNNEINVRSFIQCNYTPYLGDGKFLVYTTKNTEKLWTEVLNLYEKEKNNGGVLSVDLNTISTISSHEARIY